MNQKLSPRRRALSLLLALTLILGMLPPATAAAAEGASEAPPEHWAASYLNQMVEWGFIRADQAQNPDRALTRADFMSIVNRAYGYHEVGETPFEDVSEYDWFYDDVGIAYNAGYIKGTSPTTASPNSPLNRETATTILGRNMMLQESPGELLDFSDARDISNWARGTIKSSMEHYLVNGYDDGTFRPQQSMNWGEIAALVTRTIGTPLQDEGDYSLGGVFGNVTVTSPGVTLRDTVISGDLYVTGGVGLGGIKLENVTVLGRIIASGTGTSEGGASILLRNVTADELLIDNLRDKEVSIQADGITEIGKTTVRTSAFIQDNTPDGLGLHMISLEGDYYGEDEEVPEGWEPPKLTLAGRVEEVVNKTPNSTVHAAKGTVAKLTVDEAATGSHVVIDRGAVVKNLVLDTGVDVTGEGDVGRLEVNAPGCNVVMLPDEIVIRPGITAIIAGEEMDSASADEFLLDPMILAGYPKAQDVAPTSLEAVFATNKKGRIYWAVSAITDGSIGADDLIKPPSYGNKAVRWGTLDSPRGNEETIAKITGLTADGSYYLSAVLEDAKGQLSPVKVISFTTPDNTVPAFNQGYPHMSTTSRTNSQAVVSANKSCMMYYALYPLGATAPTPNDLKTASVSGSLGYGVYPLEKNTEFVFQVNDRTLEEETTYTIYFWLTDANGANSSPVTSLTFTTSDETPPYFLQGYPTVTTIQKNSVGLTFRINEDGVVFWAVVEEGARYPLPEPGQTGTAPLDSDYAKLQVSSGLNALASGKVNATAFTDGKINITGLEPEKTYDLYYLAQDKAGNYSLRVEKMTINTLDENGPKVINQYFNGNENITSNPKVDSSITLVFNENVCSTVTITQDFRTLYEAISSASDRDQAMSNFVTALRDSIALLKQENGEFKRVTSYQENPDPDVWVIDYSKATVRMKDGKLEVTFPDEALQLVSGGVYRFEISNLTDNSYAKRPMVPEVVTDNEESKAQGHNVPTFIVDFASITLSKDNPGLDSSTDGPQLRVWDTKDNEIKKQTDNNGNPIYAPADLYFSVTPSSTGSIDPRIAYDLMLWTNKALEYQLYYRILDKDTRRPVTNADHEKNLMTQRIPGKDKITNLDPDDNGWIYMGQTDVSTRDDIWVGKSVNYAFNGCREDQFPRLYTLEEGLIYEFIISLTKLETQSDRTAWSKDVPFRAYAIAGYSSNLSNLGGSVSRLWDDYLSYGIEGGALSIGTARVENKTQDYLEWTKPFPDSRVPVFKSPRPTFDENKMTDTTVTMSLALDRSDTFVYYVIGKADKGDGAPELITTVAPKSEYGIPGTEDAQDRLMIDPAKVPVSGADTPQGVPVIHLEEPEAYNIYNAPEWAGLDSDLYGEINYTGTRPVDVTVEGLDPATTYYAYFVLKGRESAYSEVYIYKFTTNEIAAPKITDLTPLKDGNARVELDINSYLDYRVFNAADIVNINKKINISGEKITDAAHLRDGLTEDQVPAVYRNLTLLEAMLTPFDARNVSTGGYPLKNGKPDTSKTNYSVFDVYVSAATKREIYNLILNGRTSGFYDNTNVREIDDDHNIKIDLNKMPYTLELDQIYAGNNYVILTMARSQTSDPVNDDIASIFSFRAAENVGINDQTPPELLYALCNAEPASTGTGTIQHKGKLTLVFDKDVYLTTDGGKTRLPADGSNVAPNGAGGTRNFMEMFSPSSSWGMTASCTNPPTMVFDFDFTNMPPTGSFTIPPQRICGFSGSLGQYSIVVQFGSKTSGTVTTYNVTVSAMYSDGTTKKISEIDLYDTSTQVNMYVRDDPNKTSSAHLRGSLLEMDATKNECNVEAILDPDTLAQNIVWVSRDENVATVTYDASGKKATITATGIGTTTIVATLGGDLNLAQQVINVTVDGKVTLSKTNVELSEESPSDTVTITLPAGLTRTNLTVEKSGNGSNQLNCVLNGTTLTLSGSGFQDSGGTVTVTIKGGGAVVGEINVTIKETNKLGTNPTPMPTF